MKTLIIFSIILISGLTYGQNFPAESVELILNKTVKPITLDKSIQKNAYKNFYSKFDTISKKLEKYKLEHRAFPKGIFQSDYDKLVGKEFLVTRIYDHKIYSEEGRYFVLEIKNPELGTLFYDYDSKKEPLFELEVVGGLDLPDDFYCRGISTRIDELTDEEASFTDTSEGISFTKISKNDSSHIYIYINEPGTDYNYHERGLVLLLENGKKIEKPEVATGIDARRIDFLYSAFFELSNTDINLIINNSITVIKFNNFDVEIKNGTKLSEYLKCLSN